MRLVVVALTLLLAFAALGGPYASRAADVIAERSDLAPMTHFDCDDVSQIPQAECEALVAFYVSAGGNDWAHRDGWLVTDTPCSWYGVACDIGVVVVLEMPGNQLNGSLPFELSNLTGLRVLALFANNLRGPIPPQLGNLNDLISLDLSGNQLTGSIPPQLGNLSRLEFLKLNVNRLTGLIPAELGLLEQLYLLDLSFNQLSGSIPPQMGNMARLEFLKLDTNQLSGSIPPQLGNLTELEALVLGGDNQLSGQIPPELGDLANLRILNLCGNELTGSIPSTFGRLSALEDLLLCNNRLEGVIPRTLNQLESLELLHLGYNWLTGELPDWLGDLPYLEDLAVDSTLLSGPVPLSFMNLNLNTFWFDDTVLCEPGDADFQAWLNGIPDMRSTEVPCEDCPVTVALEPQPSGRSDLQALRQFRDEIMGASDYGQRYVELYYRHAPEVTKILLLNPDLRQRSAGLIQALMPGIRAALDQNGRQVILTKSLLLRIDALLADMAEEAGPSLQATIQEVRSELAGHEGRTLPAMLLSPPR